MATQNKNLLWIVLVLVVAGAVILIMSSKQKTASSNSVTMQEVFSQKPAVTPDQVDKDPVPSPAIVTSPEHGQEAGFAVQVYSFKEQQRADAALAALKAEGYNAYTEMSDLGEKGTWYRVRISAKNENEARTLLETIRQKFNGGFIIKPKN